MTGAFGSPAAGMTGATVRDVSRPVPDAGRRKKTSAATVTASASNNPVSVRSNTPRPAPGGRGSGGGLVTGPMGMGKTWRDFPSASSADTIGQWLRAHLDTVLGRMGAENGLKSQ